MTTGRGGNMAAILCVAGICLACAPQAAQGDTKSNSQRDAQDDAGSAGDIIRRGMAAQARGDGTDLMAQARALALVAAPQDGEIDLARQWAERARELGATAKADPPFRGRTLGPGYRSGKVGAKGSFRTRQTFNAGHRAEIVVVPVNDARLSLRVVDDDGASVCAVAPSSRNLGCRWVPAFTGANEIEVRNEMDQPVSFYMVLN